MAERCRGAGAASCDALRCDVADGASIDSLSHEVHKRHPDGLDALMIVSGVAAEKQDILTGAAVLTSQPAAQNDCICAGMDGWAPSLRSSVKLRHQQCTALPILPPAGTLLSNQPAGDPDEWESMLAINTLAPMRLTRAFAPAMAKRGRGAIVTVGSLAGTFASAGSAPYASSKWGVRGWVLSTYEVSRREGWAAQEWDVHSGCLHLRVSAE